MSTVDVPRIVTLARSPRYRRAAAGLAVGFVVLTGLTWGILSLAWPAAPVHVHVRWKPDVNETERVALERRFRLTSSVNTEGTSWEYELGDPSTANIRDIVQHERVDDTSHLNRVRYRPEFAQDRVRQIWVYSLALGGAGSILLLALAVAFPRTASFHLASLSEFSADVSPGTTAAGTPASSPRAIAMALGAGAAATLAMTSLAGAPPVSAAGALVIVYAGGYVAGSLLVTRADGLSLAVIRTVAGLLLTTIGFLLSLVLSIPWFVGPAACVAAAMVLRRRTAFSWPQVDIKVGADGVAAALLAIILLSPIAITYGYMAPGSFPPVFYNVDTAYSLEKVHALVAADSYPPGSLGNLGVRRTYHYATQAMAALISRSSGLPAHQSLFLIVLPLLVVGVVAAAFAAARYISPALPRSLAVPLLLISTPSLLRPFWGTLGPQLWAAVTSPDFSVAQVIGESGLWGFLSNEGQNVGGDFVILSTVAGIAAASSWGWALPAFLIGSAVLVKMPVGIALVAGFAVADMWRAVSKRSLWPSRQMLMIAAVFGATCLAFLWASYESNFFVELFPLYHLREMVDRGFAGFLFDFLWLLLPVLIVVAARIKDPEQRSVPLLVLAIGPLLVVNMTRTDNTGPAGGGSRDDWLQILHSVPFLVHAFALSLASRRWDRLGSPYRAAFLLAIVLAIAPVATAAGRYSFLLLRDREAGNDFVDNRSLAEALAVIPTNGTIIVTNDLRYPAGNFTRDDRQLQIPALFGHQAFAVNYAYEAIADRRELQRLLQQPNWSEPIGNAARAHHWTHLIIRKDYVHPAPIPLEQIFDNRDYAVFRFP
jgi:hypothetical protein